jgi:acetyl-CoA/propionyl-CoA carboxylase biotin carboxyl carrier protein
VPAVSERIETGHRRDGGGAGGQPPFSKVLVANRGEIALRVIRACEELGIATVAVCSELDRRALHVRRAQEAYVLGGGPAAESYLNVGRLVDVAVRSGAEAVHPGYGFLAENAAFAAALEGAGIVFVGPPALAIDAMGSKTRARELMLRAGVPIIPGTTAPVATVAEARQIIAESIGYPVAIKAVGGGGGKGLRVALSEEQLEDAFGGASREGANFFSDPSVYLERYLPDPRHIEVQVLADRHGHVIHLGERDCSIQRRHQKLIEEAPAPAVSEQLRTHIGQIATDAATAVSYVGAGTIEGLLQDGEYFFLEMNTRVQVEHPVTELVTGVDIVKEGIRVAAGLPLSIAQEDLGIRGHAIECRINAEDAADNFTPTPGRIGAYHEPSGPGVRVDSGVRQGSEITSIYDPLVAKLIVWDVDRQQATARMVRALREYEIEGLTTLLPFHEAILLTEQWARGETCRDLVEDQEWLKNLASRRTAADLFEDGEPTVERVYGIEVSGKCFEVKVVGLPEPIGHGAARGDDVAPGRPTRRDRVSTSGASGGALLAPLQGTITMVAVELDAPVSAGALVCVIESMKMENEIHAHRTGTISRLSAVVGSSVAPGDTLALITADEPDEEDIIPANATRRRSRRP